MYAYSRSHPQVVDAVQAAEAAFGHVDILICCAGAAELGTHEGHAMHAKSEDVPVPAARPAGADHPSASDSLHQATLQTPGVCISVKCCCCRAAGYFHESEPDMFERQMQLNYLGSLHAAKAVYSGMVSRNSGHICFIASTMALMGACIRQGNCSGTFQDDYSS